MAEWWESAPVAGNAPIDMSRPKIQNPDGSFSTERTIGIEMDGRYYNIPTIVGGKQLSEDEAVQAFREGRNPAVGEFASQAEADAAAPKRSENIGELRGNWWADAPEAGSRHEWSVLPLSHDDQGNLDFDLTAGLPGMAIDAAKGLWSGATMVGDVLTGKERLTDEEGRVRPEAVLRGMEAVSLGMSLNPAARIGDKAIPGLAKSQVPAHVPTPLAEELKAIGGAGYNAVRAMDVRYPVDAVSTMALAAQDDLVAKGFIAENAPVTNSVLRILKSAPEGSFATPGSLDAARQALNKVQPGTPDAAFAGELVDWLDAFIASGGKASDVAGAARAADTLKEARGNYGAGKRSDRISGAEEAAELNAAASGSGRNIGNATRQRIKSILADDRKRRGFSSEQIDLLEAIVRGDNLTNALRAYGNMFGGGGGIGALLAGGTGAGAATLAGSPGAALAFTAATAVPASGMAARKASNALTSRAVRRADETVRRDSPLYRERLNAAPLEGANVASREAALRSIIMSGASAAEKAAAIRDLFAIPPANEI